MKTILESGWNEAYCDLAIEKGFLMPMDAKGLKRTTMRGG